MSSGKNNRSVKDKEMAAYLKKMGVKRTTGNCPLCHHTIPNGVIHMLSACKPRRRSYGRATRTNYNAA